MSKGLIQECSPELQPFVESILTVFLLDVKPHDFRNYPRHFWYTSFFSVWHSVQVLPPLAEIRCILPRLLHHVVSYLKFVHKIQEFQMRLKSEPKVQKFQTRGHWQ